MADLCACSFSWSDAAAWVGAIVSAGSVYAAYNLYKRTKKDQEEDLAKRGRTLNKLLERNLRIAGITLVALETAGPTDETKVGAAETADRMVAYWKGMELDRLLVLQDDLQQYASMMTCFLPLTS